jgi:hypothetical protein
MTLNRKIFSFATLTLLVALSLSSIAAWYSIQGLMAIFAAAVVPIMIMGGSLELAKVVTTVWLHKYWNRCGWRLKIYLVPSVVALALLTSMGIFGFLSKAHSDQALVSGDVGAKIAVYDTKIQTAKENIEADRKALAQMDAAVDQVMGRSTDVKGAQQSVNIRRSQAKERARLNKEIEDSQTAITKINEQAAPVRAQVRKVEAEVGPIKYIAAMIYGDNPDANLLERAVRWVIVLIVFVFDPLALTLVLAAQSSYEWLEEDYKREQEDKFSETFEDVKGTVDPDLGAPEEVVHDKCGTPECCGQCDTAVDDDFLAKLNATKTYRTVARPTVSEEDAIWTEHFEKNQSLISAPKEVTTDATETIQPDDVESDEDNRNHNDKAYHAVADENVDELDPNEVRATEPTREVITEGVTLHEIHDGYYDYEGKSMSKAALLGMHPELFAARPDSEQSNTNFGTEFPKFARKGDIFVRVDILPNRVFKFDGNKWIEINKDQSDSYLYDESYIQHLISKIDSGEYDVELLSENEKIQIEEYLHRSQSQDK